MKTIVVLTGAGMSAESGISTFRDSDGLWSNHRVEDVATPEGFDRNPALVLEFYNTRRRESMNTKPNEGHLALASMENNYIVHIVTQNVDNLHERAGSSSVTHLHGELMKYRSTINPDAVFDIDPRNPDIKIGDLCSDGSQKRPHIVWFGEAVPMMSQAESIVKKADILVVIGTSLNVYPAAGLVYEVSSQVPIYLIDPNDVLVRDKQVLHIKKGASEGMKELIRILRLESNS